MHKYLFPQESAKLREISAQSLAYVGDAVFELIVRTYLCIEDTSTKGKIHSKAVSMVSAKAQASAAAVLLPVLSENEADIYKRGRNAHTNIIPKSSTNEEYHAATGLEALFGYLYLSGNSARLEELFDIIIEAAVRN